MDARSALVLGGLYHVAFAAFHLLFWKLFDWKRDLASLSRINRAVMQILNLRLTYVFLVFAFVSLVYPADLLGTAPGRLLIGAIALFWLMRAAEQIVFFGFRHALSNALFVAFLAGAVLYTYPLIAVGVL